MCKNALTKPHKFEVNSTKSGSLTRFEFFFRTRNGQSRKIKYFLDNVTDLSQNGLGYIFLIYIFLQEEYLYYS